MSVPGPNAGIRVSEEEEQRGGVATVVANANAYYHPPIASAQFAASPHLGNSSSSSSSVLPMGQVVAVVPDSFDGDHAGGLHYKQTTDGQSTMIVDDRGDLTPSLNAGDDVSSGYGSSSVATRSATTLATITVASQESPGIRVNDSSVDDVETNRDLVPDVPSISRGGAEDANAGKGAIPSERVRLYGNRKVLLAVGALLLIIIGLVSGIICASGNCGANNDEKALSQSKDVPESSVSSSSSSPNASPVAAAPETAPTNAAAPTTTTATFEPTSVSTLDAIQERGVLRCGVYYATMPGQLMEDGTPPSGFSVDLVRRRLSV